MKTTSLFAAAVTAVGLSVLGTPAALADDVTVTTVGSQAALVDGGNVQAWTVYELSPSQDVIPYQVQGTLWEIIATDQAVQGTVIPIVSDFNLRAANGVTYPALFQVATPQGVNPATLAPGQDTSGKIYFDVTGPTPDSVVYNSFGQDRIIWQMTGPEVILDETEVVIDGDEMIVDDTEVIVEGDNVTVEETETVTGPEAAPAAN